MEKTIRVQANLFSAGGKEILVKVVVQAPPAYTMSIFKLHFSLCRELESLIGRFWWGHPNGKTKVWWTSWKTLRNPKCKGGLGFRSLKEFNQAMIAK